MKIINPIYDVAFKYLMENNQIAIDFLSVLLGINIISLDVQVQEFVDVSESTGLKLFRIDFKAVVRTPSGALVTILIEIQKSKNGFEIERFQSYLGLNYLKQNIVLVEKNMAKKEGYPIIAVYLLGFRLKNVKVPVLKVARQYLNGITQRPLKVVKEDFVEKLSHDLYAIQIPRLKMNVRTDLEKMLDVFNHKKYKTSDSRVFDYTGDTSDPRVARIVKHLGRALIDNDNLLHSMLVEDEIEAHFERDRLAKQLLEQRAEEALQAKKEALEQKEDALRTADEWKAKFEALEKAVQDKKA